MSHAFLAHRLAIAAEEAARVPEAEQLDFRDIEAFDGITAVIMGVGEPGLILRTEDGGANWRTVFIDSTKVTRSQTSSGASFTPRGSRLRKSQNSRSASVRPVRRPLTWVPCCAVGIRLT